MRRIRYAMCALALAAVPLVAQPPVAGRGGPPPTGKAGAPIDLTGYWVSIVDEDWRFRMVMPAPGDYQGVPMTPAAVKVANTWDPAKDEAAGELCKAFGAPNILRQPGHLHFTWQDDETLRMEIDAGTQTRLLHFGKWTAADGAPTLQGDSAAVWEVTRRAGPPDPNTPPQGRGSLKVTTSHLKAGYLRKNGVPFSQNAAITENYDMIREQNGDVMLVVTEVVTDPEFLREPFIITSHFKKQSNDAGWKPTPCTTRW
jgi:hypothetical protein